MASTAVTTIGASPVSLQELASRVVGEYCDVKNLLNSLAFPYDTETTLKIYHYCSHYQVKISVTPRSLLRDTPLLQSRGASEYIRLCNGCFDKLKSKKRKISYVEYDDDDDHPCVPARDLVRYLTVNAICDHCHLGRIDDVLSERCSCFGEYWNQDLNFFFKNHRHSEFFNSCHCTPWMERQHPEVHISRNCKFNPEYRARLAAHIKSSVTRGKSVHRH